MATHADEFLQQGLYLRNWSPRTVRTYRQGLATLPPALNKSALAGWVMVHRQRGLTAAGLNMYARTINSYLTWLHEEGYLQERLRIKLLPNPAKPLTTFSDADVRRILAFRPKGRTQTRTWTLIVVLFDLGVRIDEALGLEREKVDLDGLTLTVTGKGHRQRIVPFSVEGRKALYRLMAKTASDSTYVFRTASGQRLSYRNAYRDIKTLCHDAGVTGPHVHPDEAFVVQAMRHLTNRVEDVLGPGRVLLCDRDPKWSGAVVEFLERECVRIMRTPIRAPNCNAYAGAVRPLDQRGVPESRDSAR